MSKLTRTTTTTYAARDRYDGVDYAVVVTNGDKGISLSLRPHARHGMGATMTPADARALAADLLARADEIDGTVRGDVVVTHWGTSSRVEVKRPDGTGETFALYAGMHRGGSGWEWWLSNGRNGEAATERDAIDAAAAAIRAHYGVTR